MDGHLPNLEIELEDHVFNGREKDLAPRPTDKVDVVGPAPQYLADPSQPLSGLGLHVHAFQLKMVVLPFLEGHGILKRHLDEHPSQLLSRIAVVASRQLDQQDTFVGAYRFELVALHVVGRLRMGKIEVIVLINPLGVIGEDFDPHLSSYAMGPTYFSYDNIRRLRVLSAS
jgi:hypothetical protein